MICDFICEFITWDEYTICLSIYCIPFSTSNTHQDHTKLILKWVNFFLNEYILTYGLAVTCSPKNNCWLLEVQNCSAKSEHKDAWYISPYPCNHCGAQIFRIRFVLSSSMCTRATKSAIEYMETGMPDAPPSWSIKSNRINDTDVVLTLNAHTQTHPPFKHAAVKSSACWLSWF